MKTPDHYTKFLEKVPQKAGTYTYTMSMREPPLRGWQFPFHFAGNSIVILHIIMVMISGSKFMNLIFMSYIFGISMCVVNKEQM